MDPTTIISATSGALTILKAALQATKTMERAKISAKLFELQMALNDILLKQQELIEENARIKAENKELNDEINREATMEYHFGAYWERLNDGGLDGPFSKNYWEKERKKIRMTVANCGNYGEHGECYQFRLYGDDREACTIPVDFFKNKKISKEILRGYNKTS